MNQNCQSSPFDSNVIVTSSLSFTCLSSPKQDSAFYNYASNLSPLTSLKTSRLFPQANIRTPSSVFRSSPIDLRPESNFLPWDDNIEASTKKELKPCNPPAYIDEYLSSHTFNSFDDNTVFTMKPESSLSDQAEQNVSLCSQSANSALHQGYYANQAYSQHHHGPRRHLHFDDATPSYEGTTFGDVNYSNVNLSANSRNFEELLSPTGPFEYTQNSGYVVSSSKKFESQLRPRESFVLDRRNVLANETNNHPIVSTYLDNNLAIMKACLAVSYPIERRIEPCEMSMSVSQGYERVQQLNLKKRRYRRKATSKEGSCKNCHCERSKCLKLYCECFAAGVYCLDSCACKNCFNKPEYSDIVGHTRQQIVNRNPLAFHSKVTNSPPKEMNWSTTSTRHKRGCNCKKSRCLKNYCECYQANAGCSKSCRCEDCQNSYGRKAVGVSNRTEMRDSSNENKVETLNTEADGIGNQNNSSPTWEGLVDISNLTPLSGPPPSVSWTLSNELNYASVFQPQFYPGSQFQPSADSSFHLHSLHFNPDKKLLENETSGTISSFYNMNNKENIPLFTTVNDASSNQLKHDSSSMTMELRSDQKSLLKSVIPYGDSKDGVNQFGSDHNGHNTSSD